MDRLLARVGDGGVDWCLLEDGSLVVARVTRDEHGSPRVDRAAWWPGATVVSALETWHGRLALADEVRASVGVGPCERPCWWPAPPPFWGCRCGRCRRAANAGTWPLYMRRDEATTVSLEASGGDPEQRPSHEWRSV